MQYHIFFRNFAASKQNYMEANHQSLAQQQEEAFRQKADHYLLCFIEHCPLRENCLRWLVAQYYDPSLMVQTSINPLNPEVGGEHCTQFRKNERIKMKRGLTHLYHEMPGYLERTIRQQLINTWGRKAYFEIRKGDRLITPEQQNDVLRICRRNGWTGHIVYDGEQEEWAW